MEFQINATSNGARACTVKTAHSTILTPVFMLCEVFMEILIPFLMAKLIDLGIDKGDMNQIILYGFYL